MFHPTKIAAKFEYKYFRDFREWWPSWMESNKSSLSSLN